MNYNQPPPYHGSSSRSTPQYHSQPQGGVVRLVLPAPSSQSYTAADARGVERFWNALFLGVAIWLSIVVFTDGMNTLHLLVVGLKAALERILEELKRSGWLDH